MIKAQELRIGNYVSHEWVDRDGTFKEYISIWGLIDMFAIVNDNKLPQYTNINYKDVQPIPLTEDWLIKFGAEPEDRGAGFYSPHFKIILYIDEDILYLRPYSGGGYIWGFDSHGTENIELFNPKEIKHVHQLQNLYFALTGEELTIKE